MMEGRHEKEMLSAASLPASFVYKRKRKRERERDTHSPLFIEREMRKGSGNRRQMERYTQDS
jgi:hypothetical protein